MKALHVLKRDVVEACRRLDVREYVAGRDGNVSVKASDRSVLITRAGVRKGDVGVDDLVLVDREGKKLQGRGDVSTEAELHLRIYDHRPDVGAVVHAHPPTATGFAAAGLELSECVLPEVVVGLGRVPLAPYATPGTPGLSRSLDPLLAAHDACLLQNHGVVTVGADVELAYQRMETVEHSARILFVARALGGPTALTPEQVHELIESRARYGVREGLAACDLAGSGAEAGTHDDELAERVARRVLERIRRGEL